MIAMIMRPSGARIGDGIAYPMSVVSAACQRTSMCQGLGRSYRHRATSRLYQNRKCREISNPEADFQLVAPPANRELFKSRIAKARKMNGRHNRLPNPKRSGGFGSPS